MSQKIKLTTREHKAKTAAKKKRAVLNTRNPKEWRSALDAIADPILRVQAACIVWWDYFDHREVVELAVFEASAPAALMEVRLHRIGAASRKASAARAMRPQNGLLGPGMSSVMSMRR